MQTGFVSTYDAPMLVPLEAKQQTELALAFYTGYLTAFVTDFLIRPFVDKHIKGYVLGRVPIPAFDPENNLMQLAATITLALAKDSWVKHEIDITPKAYDRTNADRLKLDAIYLKIAGVNRDNAMQLFDSFNIIQTDEVRTNGRFLTRDLILDALDSLNEEV